MRNCLKRQKTQHMFVFWTVCRDWEVPLVKKHQKMFSIVLACFECCQTDFRVVTLTTHFLANSISDFYIKSEL